MNTTQRNSWDALSLREKSEMMKVAVQNGIYNLDDIRQAYNEFAEGGNIYDGTTETTQQINTSPRPITTGGAGYIPSNYGQGAIDTIRRKLYKNITPYMYNSPVQRVFNAVVNDKYDEYRKEANQEISDENPESSALDAIWATYLNIPENERRPINPQYGLTKTPEGYYRLNDPRLIFDFSTDLSPEGLYYQPNRKIQMLNGILGNHTVGLSRDNKGDYIYYTDSKLNPNGTPNIKTGWDVNPYSNTIKSVPSEEDDEFTLYGQSRNGIGTRIGKYLFGNIEDLSMGIGNTVPIYDKIYLDDYYNTPEQYKGSYYLPEVTVFPSKKALGGPLIEAANKYDGTTETTQQMNTSPRPVTTGGAGYVPSNYGQGTIDYIRRKLYDNILPWGYNDIPKRAYNAVVKNKKEEDATRDRAIRDDLWATYLQIPNSERHTIEGGKVTLSDARYKPKGAVKGKPTYRFSKLTPPAEYGILAYAGQVPGGLNIEGGDYLSIGKNRGVYPNDINAFSELEGLGQFTVGRGYDNKGEYISYYDSWDLGNTDNPYKDMSMGIGKPFNIYDRIYLDDYYDIPENKRGSYFLPEVTVTSQKSLGGPLVQLANRYDGTTEESQQMNTADLSNSRNAWYSDFERRNGRKPTWWDNYKRNLYNLVNPAEGYPTGLFDTISKGITGIAAFLAPNSVKVRRGNNIEPVSEAAWAKRLDMPYDESLVVDNGDNTYRLPKQYEQEIPVDTTMLKKRIEDNQKLADSPDVMGEQWRILNKYIEADKNALDSLRYTYATGEPVVINEFSYNSRKAMDENGNIVPVTSPLNVLQNYTIQYDKDNNSMDYRDIYDFNWFEPFVPGKPFRIQGSIPLKK